MKGAPLLCPSSPAANGALVLGAIVGRSVVFLNPAPRVSRSELAEAGEDVEERFRFAHPCQRKGCHNFGNGQCTLITRFLGKSAAVVEHDDGPVALPACDIRARCEWFRVAGPRACAICPSVRRPDHRRGASEPQNGC